MADKKFFPSFGYDLRQRPLSTEDRADIADELGEEFSDIDFADMEDALDASLGAFLHLRDIASTPKALEKRYEDIRKAAQALRVALHPEEPGVPRRPEEPGVPPSPSTRRIWANYESAKEAAERVLFRAQFPDGKLIKSSALANFEVFESVLSQIGPAAEDEKAAIYEVGAHGKPRRILSERGTAHLRYLVVDLHPIAERHGWQLKYTVGTDTSRSAGPGEIVSKLAELAMKLSVKLPEEARPKSMRTIIRLM